MKFPPADHPIWPILKILASIVLVWTSTDHLIAGHAQGVDAKDVAAVPAATGGVWLGVRTVLQAFSKG